MTPSEMMARVAEDVKFAEHVRARLTTIRLVHESPLETLNRVLRLADLALCPDCHGNFLGRQHTCKTCEDTGNVFKKSLR